MPPTKISRYEVRAELGRGGMATVYRAYDPSFDREVAIKALPREFLHDPKFRERFQREIRTIALLEHPAIVPVYDVGEDHGVPYFVMRYMPGGSLADWIDNGRLSLEETARIIDRISQALAYAHKKGVIHRDLKPDNILFDGNDEPFISDFGVAKFAEKAGTLPGANVIGTPAYMSPEQARGEPLDSRSDVYGLGVMLYQMLTGRPPYNADSAIGVAVKHITQPIPEILRAAPDLPDTVDTIVKTAMAKDKEKRYPTVTDLARALNKVAFGSDGITSLTSTSSPMNRPVSRSSGGWTGPIVAAVVVLVVLVGISLLRNQLFVPAEALMTPTPTTVIVTSTVEPPTATAIVISTETVAPTSTVIPFAPACAVDDIPTVPVPVVRETNKICVQKAPYTAMSIPNGASFVPQSPRLKCLQERVEGDKVLISCTGPQLFTFDLKVCFPPATPLPAEGQCPQSDVYNEARQCCYPPPPVDAGCTIFKVDLRACS